MKRKRMAPVKGWALVHDGDNHPMVHGDYDQEQMTVYYKKPKTDMLDERVVPVIITEAPRKRGAGK